MDGNGTLPVQNAEPPIVSPVCNRAEPSPSAIVNWSSHLPRAITSRTMCTRTSPTCMIRHHVSRRSTACGDGKLGVAGDSFEKSSSLPRA
jgi:hypothetical protein